MNITNYNEYFKFLLQKNVRFTINDKLIKRGKILLFNEDEFFIVFTLEDGRDLKVRKYSIPLPFKVEVWKNDGLVYCDYRIDTLSYKETKLTKSLEKMNNPKTLNKFFNNILQIEVQNDE